MSLQRKTQARQKSPAALRTAVENIYSKSLWERKKGAFTLKDLRNMNQTLLLLSQMAVEPIEWLVLIKFG